MEQVDSEVFYDKMIDEETHRGRIVALKKGKGYGFIDNGKGNLFFHASGVLNKKYSELIEGMEVEYLITKTPKGLKAIGVAEV